MEYNYQSGTRVHAVTSTSDGRSFQYDSNGNMTQRVITQTYNLAYNGDNRLVNVSGGATAAFTYDGNGQRVKGVVNGVTTVYVGNYLEMSGSTLVKYYYAGSQRIAMRTGDGEPDWLLGDHLGSTSVAANYDGSQLNPPAVQLYKAFGEKRYPDGMSPLPTTYRFTGQRQEVSLGGVEGLYFYGARWYDPALGRWAQPDTVIPEAQQGVQAWDRFAYVNNSPVGYNDPSGHMVDDGCNTTGCADEEGPLKEFVDELFPDYLARCRQDTVCGADYWSVSFYTSRPLQMLAATKIILDVIADLLSLLTPGEEEVGVIPVTIADSGLSNLAAKLLSVGVTFTVDRNGNLYVAPGVAAGKNLLEGPGAAPPPPYVSIAAGHFQGAYLSPEQMKSRLTGWSFSAGAEAILGGRHTFSSTLPGFRNSLEISLSDLPNIGGNPCSRASSNTLAGPRL